MNYTTLYGNVNWFLTYIRLELWDRENFSTLVWKSFSPKLLFNGVFDFPRSVILYDNRARARKSGIIFGKIFRGLKRCHAGMEHRVKFESDFDSVHCMYPLDLLYLNDTIYILYCQYPIGTFLTYVRLEKILSGIKNPARSFRTLVCESGLLRAGAQKNSSSLSSSASSSLSSSAPLWVVGGGCGMTMAHSRAVLCADAGFFPLSYAKLLHFIMLNHHTFAR